MEFKRKIFSKLQEWKTRPKRKPLLLMGARQIGKTTLLKFFGESEYDHFLYLNLERQTDVHTFFTGVKNPQSILDNLSLLRSKRKASILLDFRGNCRGRLFVGAIR